MTEPASRTQIIIAIIGLVGALGTALLYNWKTIFPKNPVERTSTPSSSPVKPAPAEPMPETNSSSPPEPNKTPPSQPDPPVLQPPPAHATLNRGTLKNSLHTGAKLYFYDFEHSQQLTECSGDADFFIKPNNPSNPDTTITVTPCGLAKYAPHSPNRRPWLVPANMFVGRGHKPRPVYQDQWIPCRTGRGNYCQFVLKLEANGDFIIKFGVFAEH